MKKLYDEVIELRNRLSPDGSEEIYQADHLLLDRVLDLLECNEQIAHKQKELLDYYRELVETIEILERDYNYGLFKFNGIKYTWNKIKELEKEIIKEDKDE